MTEPHTTEPQARTGLSATACAVGVAVVLFVAAVAVYCVAGSHGHRVGEVLAILGCVAALSTKFIAGAERRREERVDLSGFED